MEQGGFYSNLPGVHLKRGNLDTHTGASCGKHHVNTETEPG